MGELGKLLNPVILTVVNGGLDFLSQLFFHLSHVILNALFTYYIARALEQNRLQNCMEGHR